jgi:hypothetical protein
MTEKHLLSKSTFIRSKQCLKSLYLHKNRPFLRDRISPEQLAKFRRGTKIGVVAQSLFPGGINLQPKSPSQYKKAVANTSMTIEKNEYTIYEASFHYDRVLVILDVLEKNDGAICAYEVKSSLKISETYIWDAALQYYVITNSGTLLKDFFIIYMKDGFQDKEESEIVESYFITESVLDKIIPLQPEIEKQILLAKEVLLLKQSPLIDIGKHCSNPYPCDFKGHCWKHINKPSVFDLGFLTEDQKFSFYKRDQWMLENLLVSDDFSDDEMRIIKELLK